jgi:hypothetical protein
MGRPEMAFAFDDAAIFAEGARSTRSSESAFSREPGIARSYGDAVATADLLIRTARLCRPTGPKVNMLLPR